MSLTESKKRDFISMLIVILEQNAELLATRGYDPAACTSSKQSELFVIKK